MPDKKLSFHKTPPPKFKKTDWGFHETDRRPTVCLEEEDLPAIKDWKTGEEYIVVLKVRQKSSRVMDKSDGEKKSGKIKGDFEVLGTMDYTENYKEKK